jgi:hypothetical protein
VKKRVRRARGEIEVLGASFRIDAQSDGYGFENGRFTGTVLSDEERNMLMEFELLKVAADRQVERICVH